MLKAEISAHRICVNFSNTVYLYVGNCQDMPQLMSITLVLVAATIYTM